MKTQIKLITYLNPEEDITGKRKAGKNARDRKSVARWLVSNGYAVRAVLYEAGHYNAWLGGNEDTLAARAEWASTQKGERVTAENLGRLFQQPGGKSGNEVVSAAIESLVQQGYSKTGAVTELAAWLGVSESTLQAHRRGVTPLSPERERLLRRFL